ncbi:hypothetical protein WN943_003462 [Citrus x changshan-huyou]
MAVLRKGERETLDLLSRLLHRHYLLSFVSQLPQRLSVLREGERDDAVLKEGERDDAVLREGERDDG